MTLNTKTYLEKAIEAAKEGGNETIKYWGEVKHIEDKSTSGDLVTEADKASEEKIIQCLKSTFPSHQILAEESGWDHSSDQDFVWAIDPLDGTTNYAHQFPFFAVSIALLFEGKPVVGVVYNPVLEELFFASKNGGAYFNQRHLKVSRTNSLKKSLWATGFHYSRRTNSNNNYLEFAYMTHLSHGVRRSGCASLDLSYVGAGKLDGFWERDLNTWDIAAGALIIEEAGGKVTDYEGQKLDYLSPKKIVGTNGFLHEKTLIALKKQEGQSLCFMDDDPQIINLHSDTSELINQ